MLTDMKAVTMLHTVAPQIPIRLLGGNMNTSGAAI